MNLQTVDNIITFTAGALISVESSLLLIGMNLPQPSNWSTPLNITFAISDIILGGFLVYLSLSGTSYDTNPLYYIALSILFLTHGFRSIDYFVPGSNPFAANLPLFFLNNVRIIFIGTSFGLSLRLCL